MYPHVRQLGPDRPPGRPIVQRLRRVLVRVTSGAPRLVDAKQRELRPSPTSTGESGGSL